VDDLRESPSLSIIEMLQQEGAAVGYNDPFFPTVGRGRKYNLNMQSQPVEKLDDYDCVLIVTDHSSYDYARIVDEARLVVDTRNATRGLVSEKIVRC
jgi:UDP-N-acetyl-D-glucosamine dehydrogenase